MSAKPKGGRKRIRTTKHTTMRLSPDLMERLRAIADSQERSRTWIVERILRDYLNKSAADLRSVFE